LRLLFDPFGHPIATITAFVGGRPGMVSGATAAMAKNTRERYGIRRLQVEAALARIDAGTFGLCCLCRDPLDTERLDSDPAVVFCADCAEAREQERGQR
jgi:RNA polymerase-binding transcription factor DksA